MIRAATIEDTEQIRSIYNYYVTHTCVTFEEVPVALEVMAERVARVGMALPWLVWLEGGAVLGYAYADQWRQRSAYRHSVESTVYLHPDAVGRGIGTRLYGALLNELRGRPVHAVIAGIALPNAASVALHQRLGFAPVAHFPEVGWKFRRWIDVVYWQRLL